MGPEEIQSVEPHAVGVQALHVPETAIIDFAQVARALAEEVRSWGGSVLTANEVIRVEGARLETRSGLDVEAGRVISSAGVQSDRLAALTGLSTHDYRISPFRGDYFTVRPEARSLVRGLIYQVPDPSFPFLRESTLRDESAARSG